MEESYTKNTSIDYSLSVCCLACIAAVTTSAICAIVPLLFLELVDTFPGVVLGDKSADDEDDRVELECNSGLSKTIKN